jgi:hypothetical protein
LEAVDEDKNLIDLDDPMDFTKLVAFAMIMNHGDALPQDQFNICLKVKNESLVNKEFQVLKAELNKHYNMSKYAGLNLEKQNGNDKKPFLLIYSTKYSGSDEVKNQQIGLNYCQ